MNQAIAQSTAVLAVRFRAPRIGALLLALVLAVVAGYRWLGEGADYVDYFLYYLTVTEYVASNVSRFEIGFQYWAWFSANILHLSFQMFYTATVFFALYVKFSLIKKHTYEPWFAILAYLLLFYPVHEYTQVRIAVAMAFVYFGIFKLYERNYVLAAAGLALSVCFHSSALVAVVIAVGAMYLPLYVTMIGFFFSAIAILIYGDLVTALILRFFNFNSTIEGIIDNVYLSRINLVSVTNVCLAVATALCVAGGAHQGKLGRTFLTMSISAFAFMFLFQASPILAQRVKEMLWVAIIFLAFRPATNRPLLAARIVLILGGVWGMYRGFSEGVLG